MNAIRVHAFGGPEVLTLEEADAPRAGRSQVLVRIRAAGVNPVDTYIRSGAYTSKPALPYVPGTDGAGTVDALGEGVTGVSVGDRVYVAGVAPGTGSGTYAELAVCEAHQVHAIPPHVSFAQGAAVNVPYGTAYQALARRARAQAGETLLVHGATGGVGIAAVQLGLAYGMRVYGTGGSERGRQLLRDQGLTHVLDHGSPSYLDEFMSMTGGRGADVILEMAAHINLGKDLGLLARHGRVVVIGNRGPIEINARLAMQREGAIIGMMYSGLSPAETDGIHCALVAGLANGTLKPVVGRELPIAEAARAHAAVMEPGAFGKIVLVL